MDLHLTYKEQKLEHSVLQHMYKKKDTTVRMRAKCISIDTDTSESGYENEFLVVI